MSDDRLVATLVQLRYDTGANPRARAAQAQYDALMAVKVRDGFFNSSVPAPSIDDADALGILVTHRRGGMEVTEPAWLQMPVFLGDILVTGPLVVSSIEFVIGGRVGINSDSAVKVAGERWVEDARSDLKRIVLRKFGIWEKTKRLKEPLDIQTNGGIVGIRG